jgi:hypothetical protein
LKTADGEAPFPSSNPTVSAGRPEPRRPIGTPIAEVDPTMDRNEESERTRIALREFALACRVERDRIACARLAAEDRRFESWAAGRAVAEFLAARLIAAVAH